MDQATVHNTLVKARKEMKHRGMVKSRLRDSETGAVCLRGAILVTIEGERPEFLPTLPTSLPLLRACEEAMGFPCLFGEAISGAALWNNLEGTTLKMVLDRFTYGINQTKPPMFARWRKPRKVLAPAPAPVRVRVRAPAAKVIPERWVATMALPYPIEPIKPIELPERELIEA